MKIILFIIFWIFNPIVTPEGIQIGEISINNQKIKIMKKFIVSPEWLQSGSNVGGGAGEYISFVDSADNPQIFQLSAIGDVTIQSIYNGEPIRQIVTNPTDTGIQIQSDANTEVVLYGKITKLHCQPAPIGFTHLTSIDVSHAKSLTYLDCGSNQLTSLDVNVNTALTYLDCGSNQLTSLDVSANTALTVLYCGSNQLTSLDVSANTALTELDCSSNQLTSLDVGVNTALTYLNCKSNQLTSLGVNVNTALTYLDCGSNQLTSLDVNVNTALTYLDCGSNQLTSLDVSANTALTVLYCGSNQLTSLDVSANTALTELSCEDNQTLLTIDGIGVNESVSASIAGAITGATSVDGTVTLRNGDEYNQTIIDAAMEKGWDVQYYQ